jgi:hypothetical protein
MLPAGSVAAKYVKDTDDEEADSHEEEIEAIEIPRILRGWLHISTPPFLGS